MKIIQLAKNNISQIIKLEKEHAPDKPFYARYDKKTLRFIFDNPKICRAYGLFDKNELVGWGAYRTQWSTYNSKEKRIFEINSIVINTNYRRRGFGKKLLAKIISTIKKSQDYKDIYLTVSPLNIGALLLYLKNGFHIYDFKKNVYGKGADRLYLKLNLS